MKISTSKNDVYVSEKEAESIRQKIEEGNKWINIGNEMINTSFVVGIFEGEDPNWSPEIKTIPIARRISASKNIENEQLTPLREAVEKLRQGLIEKGIIGNKSEYQKNCENKNLEEEINEIEESNMSLEEKEKNLDELPTEF